ncbi:MAG: hypothetical protein Q7T96_19935 [Methylobacter sp.]|nr:hypothetical protein [Methylobacter sp.]
MAYRKYNSAHSRLMRFFIVQNSALLYVGLGGAVARLAGSVVPERQLRPVRHPLKIMVSAYKNYNRDNTMTTQAKTGQNNSAQNSEQISAKAYAPTQLLNKLQQAIDATIEQLTDEQRVQFGNALKHVQRNHDFFQKRINDPDIEGGLEQMVSIFTTQLDEILAAAQTQRSIDDAGSDFVLELTTNEFSPRAKTGQRLGMRRGCQAED